MELQPPPPLPANMPSRKRRDGTPERPPQRGGVTPHNSQPSGSELSEPPPPPPLWPQAWQPSCRGAIRVHERGKVNCSRPFAKETRALTAGEDGQLCVVDLATGAGVGRALRGHAGPVEDCCIFPDDRRALSCGEDKALRVWCLQTFQCVKVVENAHAGAINSVTLFQDGERTLGLSASDDATLKVWDMETAQCIATLEGSTGAARCCKVFFGETGIEAISGGADNHVRRWALNDVGGAYGRELTHPPPGPNLDYTPWLQKANMLQNREGHTGIVTACDVSDDNRLALSCSGDRSAIVWDLAVGQALRKLHEGNSLQDCCFLPGSRRCMTASNLAPRLWDVHSGELIHTFCGHSGPVTACTFLDGGMKALTCGTASTVRVWDLSAHDNVASLGFVAGEQHKSVVKELVVFPDASRAVSCSYGSTGQIKIWSLESGKLLRTFEGHCADVNEICIFPPTDSQVHRGKEMLLSGSKDGTLRVWEVETGECILTMGEQRGSRFGNAIRGCGIFAGGTKVFSCSKDSSITVYDLEVDGRGQMSGQCTLVLEGHTDLVDRCCVYDNDSKMLSASWDKTCKAWDLATGELLFTMKDVNKVRGVAVYGDARGPETRAVTVGSGKYLTVWDLKTKGTMVEQIDMSHGSTVWGLKMIPKPVLLYKDGIWTPTTTAVTYSNDGSTKCWDLTPEQECEIVHGRRAFDPTPMCVAVIPENYRMGRLPVLVGGYRSIKLCDMSMLGSGASAGALWSARVCIPRTIWVDWIMETIAESGPHFMYIPERNSNLPTIIHKLAAISEGDSVLQQIMVVHAKARHDIVRGKPFVREDRHHMWALGTMGMISRAGTSPRGSALGVAMDVASEGMAKLLLDDYVQHIASFAHTRSRDSAPATVVCELTEADMIKLFDMFPDLAASFLVELPLQATNLVDFESKCDFTDAHNDRFVHALNELAPPAKAKKDSADEYSQWWDAFIDDKWENSVHRDQKKKSRMDDTAWGHRVNASRVPLSAGGFSEREMLEKNLIDSDRWASLVKVGDNTYEELVAMHGKGAPLMDAQALRQALSTSMDSPVDDQLFERVWKVADRNSDGKISALEFENLCRYLTKATQNNAKSVKPSAETLELLDSTDNAAMSRDVIEALLQKEESGAKLNLRGREISDDPADEQLEHCSPPFSRLLETVCHHARRTGSPEIFLSPSLQAIIQYKWESKCRAMYRTSVCMYTIFLLSYTLVVVQFEDWTAFDQDQVPTAVKWVMWILWGFSSAFVLTVLKHECHQIAVDGLNYLTDIFNWIDIFMGFLALYALQSMAWIDGSEQAKNRLILDAFQSQSMLFCWLRLLYFLRALDQTAFLINMLFRIIAEMKEFLLVMVVVLIAFTFALYLLFRHDLRVFVEDSNIDHGLGFFVEDSNFDTTAMSFIGAVEMMFGNFDVSFFRRAQTNSAVALIDFVLFMLILPLVMLNALIAIMGDTYSKVAEEALESKLHQRAEIILELEQSYMVFERGAKPTGGVAFVLKTLLTMKMPYGNYPRYIHQLSPRQHTHHAHEDRGEQLKMLIEDVQTLAETVEVDNKRAVQRMDSVEERVKDLQEELQVDLQTILMEMRRPRETRQDSVSN